MKDYEKAIEEAAHKHAENREHKDSSRYSFLYGAKSPEAKEFHQQGMYSEEEVLKLCYSAMKERDYTPWNVFDEWWKHNKKKNEEPTETAKECPIGSYEAENRVVTCTGSSSCIDLCKTCVNYTK